MTFPNMASADDFLKSSVDRSVGTRLSLLDSVRQCLLSVQVFSPYPNGNFGIWNVSNWNQAFWATGGVGVDITARARALQWVRGADSPGGRPKVGTATLTLSNADGLVSPWATSGAFTLGGKTWLHSGTYFRWGINYLDASAPVNGIYVPLFAGRVESLNERTSDGADAWVDVVLIEVLADLGAFKKPAKPAAGAGDDLVTRVSRLLTDARFSGAAAYFNDIHGATPGDFTVTPALASKYGLVEGDNHSPTFQATTLSAGRLEELYLTGDSAGVRIFSTADGQCGVSAPTTGLTLADLPGATYSGFSNDPVAGTELPVSSDAFEPYASKDRILNDVSGKLVGAVKTERAVDRRSVAKYGTATTGLDSGYPREDLICTENAVVQNLVNNVVAAHAWDEIGIPTLDLDADMDAAHLFFHMALLMGNGVENRLGFDVRWVHPSGHVFSEAVLLDGISNALTKEGSQCKWTASLSLSAANPGPT